MTSAHHPRRSWSPTARIVFIAALAVPIASCGTWESLPSLPTIGSDEPAAATPPRATTSRTSGQTTSHAGVPAGTATTSGGNSAANPGPNVVEMGVVPGIAGEPDIRVRLRDGTTTAKIGLSSGDAIWVYAPDRARPAAAMRPPITVALDEGGWLITDAAGLTGRFPRLADVQVAPQREMINEFIARGIEPGAGTDLVTATTGITTGRLARAASTVNLTSKLTLDAARFGGKFILTARSDISARTFDLIEHVGVEEYLVGVVAAEMWPNWPRQAFGAQAVAARSYAIQQRGLSRSQGARFDVESSVRDQAYKGATENPNAVLAVRDTEGVVLTWNNQVIRAYYSSTTGPNPANARDTWPVVRGYEYNLAGPLQAGDREVGLGRTSPYYRWSVTRTRADLTARLREWGRVSGGTVKTLGEIVSVRAAATNASGRPTKFAVTDRAGVQHTLSAEQLRQACNTDAPGLAKVVKETRVNSSNMDAWTITGETVIIAGRGFGHGVGMCQYSAKELADRGEKWNDIVTRFYPGARLQRAY